MSAAIPCNDCNGTGTKVETVQDGKTMRQTQRTCPRCAGRGVVG